MLYREELMSNDTVCVASVWGGQYRGELIMNASVCFVSVWGGNI